MWVKLKCSYHHKGGEAGAGTVIEVSAGEGKRLVSELGVAEPVAKPATLAPAGKATEKTDSTVGSGADGGGGGDGLDAGGDTDDNTDPSGGQQ